MAIRVFVYDDNQSRVDSLEALLELSEEIRFVGYANDCRMVVQDIEKNAPDVVLMDINMPHVDGIEGLQAIKKQFPEIRVLMQTAFDDSDKIFRSIERGASGYILKSDKPGRILDEIKEVYEGGAVMNPSIAQRVLNYFLPKERKSPLSDKEEQVLHLLAEGKSYKMIAAELGISYSTVNTHTKHIYEKLHISSLGEAIAWFYKNKP